MKLYTKQNEKKPEKALFQGFWKGFSNGGKNIFLFILPKSKGIERTYLSK